MGKSKVIIKDILENDEALQGYKPVRMTRAEFMNILSKNGIVDSNEQLEQIVLSAFNLGVHRGHMTQKEETHT